MNGNWGRVGIGAGTAVALVIGAGLAATPAQAATHGGGLLGGSTGGGLTGTVTSLLGGLTSGAVTGTPVAVSSSNGTISVGVGGTTVGVTATDGTLGAGITTGAGAGVGVTVGGGGTGTVGVTDGAVGGVPGGTTGSTTTAAPAPAPVVTGLGITSSVATVYPARDGYLDAVVLHVDGTTASGAAAAPVTGVVVVKRGDEEVRRWRISSSDADLTWDGRVAGRILPGAYTVTAVAVDAAGTAVAATAAVAVSPKRLVTATHTISRAGISGTHRMAAKPRAGLSKGTVVLRLRTRASGVVGKQYLVFSHGRTTLKVRITNGTHTSKAVRIPRSFTTYRVSHTWKRGAVHLDPVVYRYSYKRLR